MGIEEDRFAFEKEKWRKESAQRDRELDQLGNAPVWRSPLALGIFPAAIAAISNAAVALYNGRAEVALEDRKADAARILEMISAPSQEEVRTNLQFLLDTNLIKDDDLSSDLREALSRPESLPTLIRRWAATGASSEGFQILGGDPSERPQPIPMPTK